MQGTAGVYHPYLPTEITALDGLRVGKGLVDHAFATTAAFITHEWIHIELPAVDPIPPPYPEGIDPLAGISPANAAAVGKKYFQDAYSHIVNLGMPPPDPNVEVPPLEIRPEEGLSAYNASIVGRKVVVDILSYVIESAMNTATLLYTVGKAVMNVAKRVLGIPVIEEPPKAGNAEEDANELNALDGLDDTEDVEATEEGLGVDQEESVGNVDLDGNPLDVDGDDLDVDDEEPLDDDLVAGDPSATSGGVAGHTFAAPNPGDPTGAPAAARTRRVAQTTQRAQRAVQLPPPRIEDTDPFYTTLPQMTQPQIDDLTSVLTLLNGTIGSITMNAGSLRRKGANIDGVHPFRFLSQVMTTPDLRDKFQRLRARTDLIGSQFVGEFDAKFNGYQDRGELLFYHKGFAHAMRVNPANVEKLCNEKKWRLLIVLLIETATGARPPFIPKAPPPVKQFSVARTPARRQALPGAGQPAFMAQPGASSQNPFGTGTFQVAAMQTGNPFATNIDDDGLDVDGSDAGDPVDDVDGDLSGDEVGSDEEVGDSPEVAGEDQVEEPADDLDDLAVCNPLTGDQKTTTLKIFQRVATESPLTLGLHALSIRNEWRQLHDTHPAMLLKEVFENPEIVNHLRTIRQDVTKRDLFINDLCDALAKGEQKNPDNTLEKTNETLTALGFVKTLTPSIDWKALVKELIADKCTIRTSELLTPMQTQVLSEVLTDIATTNEFMLLGHLISLRKKWSSLEDVCPLQMLRWMFTENLDLVGQIVSKSAKKGPFINDVASTLKNCSKMRDFSTHTAAFAAEFNIDENLVTTKDWSKVLKGMIDQKVVLAVPTPKVEPVPLIQTSDPLSGTEKQVIDELFSDLATKNELSLLRNRSSLQRKWSSLENACPLQILRYVFTDRKADFHQIINQAVRRAPFLNDFAKAVKAAGKDRDLSSFAAAFSLEFSVPQDLILQKEWSKVIDTIKAKQVADSERASQVSTGSRASSTTGNPLPVQTLQALQIPLPTPKSDPLSVGEKQAIDELFSALATKNEMWLLGNVAALQRKWSSLENACPLQILRYVFTEKKDTFHQIINQAVRRGPFLNDLVKAVKNAGKESDLTTFAEAFSLEFNVPQDLILHKDWAKIVDTIKAKQIADSERASQTSTGSKASSSSNRPHAVPSPILTPAPTPKSDPLSVGEKQAIDELFSALATKNEMWLLGNTIPLQRKWASLEQACPLQILRYVFTDKKDVFHQIFNQAVRRGPFLNDLIKTVKNAGKQRDLTTFAEAFSLEFTLPQDLILRKEWGAVIDAIKAKQIADAETASRASSSSNPPPPTSSRFGNPFKAGGLFSKKK